MKLLFKFSLIFILLISISTMSAPLTQNVTFTDSKTGNTQNLYDLLDAGHYVLMHASWKG